MMDDEGTVSRDMNVQFHPVAARSVAARSVPERRNGVLVGWPSAASMTDNEWPLTCHELLKTHVVSMWNEWKSLDVRWDINNVDTQLWYLFTIQNMA